jgi:hypothetical protein
MEEKLSLDRLKDEIAKLNKIELFEVQQALNEAARKLGGMELPDVGGTPDMVLEQFRRNENS